MSRLSRITVAVTAAGVARQGLVLAGIVRSARFLRQDRDPRPPQPLREVLIHRAWQVAEHRERLAGAPRRVHDG